jgi:hypothetical protein
LKRYDKGKIGGSATWQAAKVKQSSATAKGASASGRASPAMGPRGLDALKCCKSEIVDIFLFSRYRDLEGCQAIPPVLGRRGWTMALFQPKAGASGTLRSSEAPATAGGGLDCHSIVAKLVVTALWPKYWMEHGGVWPL